MIRIQRGVVAHEKPVNTSAVVNTRRLTRDDPTTTGFDVAQAPSRFVVRLASKNGTVSHPQLQMIRSSYCCERDVR